MMRSLLLFCVLLAVTGCKRKSGPDRAADLFLFSKKAGGAAALPWKDWSAAAFEESRNSGKPVFLSLTRSLCSWCTLLDETTLSNERVGELLGGKFILLRVNADIYPEVANRFGAEGIPRVAILNGDADLLWDGPFLQPKELNQFLNRSLRGELEVKLKAGQMRYDPNPLGLSDTNRLDPQYALQFLNRSFFEFDNENKGYEARGKALSIARLEYDLNMAAVEWRQAESRKLVDKHLNSVFTNLHDAHDGGFLTGSYDAAWNDFIPVKRADEQAAMAAFLTSYSYWAGKGIALTRSAKAMSETAEATIAYLEQRLIDSGHVFTGEIGTRDYYRSERRGSFAGTQTNSVLQTSVAARVADKLAEAGHWAGNKEWIDKAARIARHELDQRTANGLFWHVKNVTGDRLEDASAMLAAMLSLYTATGDDVWLREAESIATAMERLYSPNGYYLDVTEGTTGGPLRGEPVPSLNTATAASLFKLAIITQNRTWGLRAEKVTSQFAISPVLFLYEESRHARLVWQLTHAAFRVELPRTWRSMPAADGLVHPVSSALFVRWIDGNQGKVCYEEKCSLPFGAPEQVLQASQAALSTVQLPGKANLKNPFFQ